MTTSSSPAPIVFTSMISNVAARSTGCCQSVRTPASMLPGSAAGSLWEAPSPGGAAGTFVRAVVMTEITKEPAVTRNGTACPSVRRA